MIQKIFTIYDEKAKAYLPPFFMPESGMAIRTFSDCINSKDHQFAKNPDDYTLFGLGHFNDATASLEPYAPKSLGNGLIFLDRKMPEYSEEIASETALSNDPPIQPGTRSGNSS